MLIERIFQGRSAFDVSHDASMPRPSIAGTNLRHAHATELCVCCNGDTGVPTEQPVSLRKYYVPGVGQLCEFCA